VLLILVGEFVRSLRLQPVLAPLEEIKGLKWVVVIIAVLKCTNKVIQGGVAPGVTSEINVQTLAESLPSHQEDELLNHARTLAVSNAVNE